MDTFGERLKYLIKHSDIKTIKAFSERVGVHEVSASKIVRGVNKPSYEVIEACTDIFSDEELIWLLSGREFMNELKFENEQLKRENTHLKKVRSKMVKPYSNQMNPRKSKAMPYQPKIEFL